MKDSTIFLMGFILLMLIGLFNVYMNLYNDHHISEIKERVDKLESVSRSKLDTIYINKKDTTFTISWYR